MPESEIYCGSVEFPCVVQLDAGDLAAIAMPMVFLLVVVIALLVRSLK